MSETSSDKVEAIFELREAVVERVHAEYAVEREPSPAAREALLDATLKVEAKTQDAIETCHSCSRAHASNEPHEPHEASSRIGERSGNVVSVDFRPEEDRDEGRL